MSLKFIETNDIDPLKISLCASIGGASVVNANFPLANVLDKHPLKITKATTNVAYLEIELADPSDVVAIFNTNAEYVEAEVWDATKTTLLYSESKNLRGATSYLQLTTDRDKPDLHEWFFEYPYYAGGTHFVQMMFYVPAAADDPYVSIGIVHAGVATVLPSPQKGIQQSFKDFSVIAELNSGATYIQQRPLVRTFSFNLELSCSSGDPEILKSAFTRLGPWPMPWLISDTNQEMWLVYARKDAEPSGSFHAHNRTRAEIKLVEVI